MNALAIILLIFVAVIPIGLAARKKIYSDTAWFMVRYAVLLSGANWMMDFFRTGLGIRFVILVAIYLVCLYWAIKEATISVD